MSLILFKLIATSTIFATSMAGMFLAKRAQISLHYIKLAESFASGVFLGAALFHMLPDAEKGFLMVTSPFTQTYPFAHLLCGLGFLLLLAIELTITRLNRNTLSYLLVFILSSHSIVAGAALGSYNNIKPALIIFTAIILHKGFASFALATKLFKEIVSGKQRLSFFLVFALMTPLGILITSTINRLLHTQSGLLIEAGLNAFAAGTFLYLGTWHTNAKAIFTDDSKHQWLYRFTLAAGIIPLAILGMW